MYSFSFGDQVCVDPVNELQEQLIAGYDVSIWKDKAIHYKCPLGDVVGTGSVLLTYKSLSLLDINALHKLKVVDMTAADKEYSLGPFLITKAICLTPGVEGDENAVYLVEFVDKRWIAKNTPLDFQVNITTPKHSKDNPSYYKETKDPQGNAWTWESCIHKIWDTDKLGDFPGLPYSPVSTPENFQFLGVDTYTALNTMLAKIHCALQYNPLEDKFNIIDLTAKTEIENIENTLRQFLVFDAAIKESIRARIPKTVRVYFNVHENYGVEHSTTEENNWLINSYIYKEKQAKDYSFEEGMLPDINTYIFWDDLKAIRDNGQILNDDKLEEKVQQIASKFYGNLKISDRKLRKYYGFRPEFIPAGDLKLVCWRFSTEGTFTEIASTIGFIDGNTTVSNYEILKSCENLSSPDISRSTFPLYFSQNQIVQIEDKKCIEKYYYKGAVYNLIDNELQKESDCYIYVYPSNEEDIEVGTTYIAKVSGRKTLNEDTRMVFTALATSSSNSTNASTLIKVTNHFPIYTFEKYDYFQAKIITFEKKNIEDEQNYEIQEVEGEDCYVALTHNRRPELNIIIQSTEIGSVQDKKLFRVVPEYVRFVKLTETQPAEGNVYKGIAYGLNYNNEGEVTTDENNFEACYINDLRDLSVIPNVGEPAYFDKDEEQPIEDPEKYTGTALELKDTIIYIGRYQGILNIQDDPRPSYAIDPDYICVGTESEDNLVNPIKKIIFNEDNFTVEDSGLGNAYIKGLLIQNDGEDLHRRKILNFKTEKYDPDNPPDSLFFAEDNEDTEAIDVTLYTPPTITPVVPIYIDYSDPGIAKIGLETPLKVIYGGTQREILDKGATIVGDDEDPVYLTKGNPYTIFNHKYNYNFPFPEWSTWSKIQAVTQTGIHYPSGKTRKIKPLNLSDYGQGVYGLYLSEDKYTRRNHIRTEEVPSFDELLQQDGYFLYLLPDQSETIGSIGLHRWNKHSNTFSEYSIIVPPSIEMRGIFPYVYDIFIKDGKFGLRHISDNEEEELNILIPTQFQEDVEAVYQADIEGFYYKIILENPGNIYLEDIYGLGRGGYTSSFMPGPKYTEILGNIDLQGSEFQQYLNQRIFTTEDILLGYACKGAMSLLADITPASINQVLNLLENIE